MRGSKEKSMPDVLDSAQLVRIEAVHRGFLYGVRLENGNYPTLRLFFVQSGIDCT